MNDTTQAQDHAPYVWPDHIAERAKALWPNMSAANVADIIQREFGVWITGDQVTNKMRRLGIHKVSGRKNGSQGQFEPKFPAAAFVPRTAEVPTLNIPLVDLGRHQCRYECSGQEDPRLYTFCGNPTRDERCPYCAPHAGIAYRPVEARPPR